MSGPVHNSPSSSPQLIPPPDLLSLLKSKPRPVDLDLITKAAQFAHLAHTGQARLSGDAYITHPLEIARTLARWDMDTTTIVAGLLHDTIEDGGATRADLVKEFGEDIATVVDGVTKITHIHLKGSVQEQFVENLRKMLLVMAQDLRVVIVKLADRLHNMQTLQYLTPAKQLENSLETLEIYAPLAERLGMGEIKGQLEDLAFPFVYPSQYANLKSRTQDLYAQGEVYIKKFRRELLSVLTPQLPHVIVNTRHKHLFSLFKKLARPEIDNDLTRVHDLAAARVLVDRPEECYLALGAIHSRYHPVPSLGISDFIANPKPNGYQSIHTKVFGPQGKIVEIQIRTHVMHEQAEMGIAAHWQYSEAKTHGVSGKILSQGIKTSSSKLAWVKQLVSWQQEITDSADYLKALKFDALQHRILVFSPVGDVYDLPQGATPIDFAYAVHTDLGHQASGAKINTQLVPLNKLLKNGDVVEILIDRKRSLPNPDWLEFVVTNSARREITKAVK